VALLCISFALSAACPVASSDPGIGVHHVKSIECEEPVTGFGFSPLGLGFGMMGELYVVDADNARIFMLPDSLDGLVVFADCPGEFPDCQFVDLETDDAGEVWVSEKSNNTLMVFDRWGNLVSSAAAGEGIAGISQGRAGKVYCAMTISGTVRIIDADNLTEAIDCTISDGADNAYPVDCLVHKDGRVFVSDAFSKQVRILGLLGDPRGRLEGFRFGGPFGLATYLDTFVLVADSELGLIAVFGPGGDFLGTFGQDLLSMPTFLGCRDDGVVCVGDAGSMTIEVFKIDRIETQ
jgi:DNA-binding beta-propeller fold protein YncE